MFSGRPDAPASVQQKTAVFHLSYGSPPRSLRKDNSGDRHYRGNRDQSDATHRSVLLWISANDSAAVLQPNHRCLLVFHQFVRDVWHSEVMRKLRFAFLLLWESGVLFLAQKARLDILLPERIRCS